MFFGFRWCCLFVNLFVLSALAMISTLYLCDTHPALFFIRLTAWCTNCSSLVNSNGINSPLGFSYIFDFWVSSHLLGIPSRIPTMYKDMEQNFIPLWSVRYYNTQVPIYSCRFLWITQNMMMIYVRESYPWRIVFLLGTEWTSSSMGFFLKIHCFFLLISIIINIFIILDHGFAYWYYLFK